MLYHENFESNFSMNYSTQEIKSVNSKCQMTR